MASKTTNKNTKQKNQNTNKKTKSAVNKKTNNRSKNKKKKSAKQNFLVTEITVWGTLAACILMAISNFGFGGFIGEYISGFIIDSFGWMGYILPILLFTGVTFLLSNKGNMVAYMKTAAGTVLFVLICMFFELTTQSGGSIGELLTDLLIPAIGKAGTYVVVIILSVICIVLITERSILRSVKKGGSKAYDIAKTDVRKKREENIQKREQRIQHKKEEKEARTDHVVSGVSFHTTLENPTVKNPPQEIDTSKTEKSVTKKTKKDIGNVLHEANDATAQHILDQTGKIELEDVVINRAMPLSATELFADEPDEDKVKPPTFIHSESADTQKSSKQPKEKVDVKKETDEVEKHIEATKKIDKPYHFPPMNLLKHGDVKNGDSDLHLRETAKKLQKTLQTFGVNVTITNISCGPSVTRYELQPELGVKVSKIVGLADDIKLNLAAADIRIEAPIPGKAAVGIEVPNKENSIVMLRDLLESSEFKNSRSKISFATGRDIGGKVVVSDIAKMPHLLVAGATGSGKSVCINTLIMSVLYKATPDEVKLIMIDPKVVELSVYNGIPHLMIPVVTDPKKAAGALNWAVSEMTKRYQLFADYNVRDIKGYNAKVDTIKDIDDPNKATKMPQIIIIVDELADLMMVAPGEVEESICRLAQLARAAGIHLVLATQRPSVNVITGLIKANMPSRIAFSVSSGVDSRTIIDMNGAEKLLGKGDMLFYPSGYQKPVRVQGAFVSDQEVQAVVDYLKENSGQVEYDEEIQCHVNSNTVASSGNGSQSSDRDVYFVEAAKFIIDKDKASIGMLQRVFKIGFNRAARIMDQLAEAGVVGEEEGTKPRKVLMSMEEFEQFVDEYV